MSVRKVQLRRGTGAENDAFTGAVGEITVNTTNNTIRVHDGATLGGSETALTNLSNVLPTQNLDFDEYRIVNVADPVDLQDVATKNYVDSQNDLVNSLAELTDVDVAGVDPGEFLKYSGTEWINTTISTADLQDGLDIPMMVGGTITANLDGNAVTSTAWISAMTLNLTGTVLTGSVAFDGSQSVNLNASLNNASVSNAKLENSSVNIGAYTLSLGSTLHLSNDFQITGSTLSFAGGGGAPTALSDLTDTNLGGYAGGQVLVYNPDNSKWENKSVVGDATLTSTGTLILSAIDNAKLVNSTINIGGSPIALGGTVNLTGGLAITGNTLSVGNVDTATKLFTAVTLGLGGSVITGSVSFDGSQSVEIIADVTPLSITNGMIADGTITNGKLEHDFIAFNNHEVHLGESVTIEGTDGEISVAHNAGVYTIGLAGTIVASSAVALAKTINLAGNATGSVSLDNALASVTLNVTLGTITNAMLEHDFISVNDFQLHLSENLDVVGADGVSISLDENTSILTVGLGTISTTKLSSNFITIADNDSSENIVLGGTLNFLGVENETSVFVATGLSGEIEVNVGLAENVSILGNLTVGGSLIVNGTTTSINTVNLDVVDSIVLLGKGTNAVNDAVNDAGFIIERGSSQQSASLFWDENSSRFAIVTADSIGSSTTNIVNQASNLSYADLKLNTLYANAITGSTLSLSADAQLTVDSAITFNDIVNLKDVEINSTSPVGYLFQTIHDTNQTFVLNSDTGNIETVGNITVQGDLYASNIIESANGAGITLQDTTSVNANLDVYNPTGALINGTTVYLYVKYGADSIANGEYFHIFKTNDGGSIRQVVPLTLLQDGGQNKLAVKAGDIYEYQAVAGGDYPNINSVPNASFVLDTEGGAYTYQIRAYTDNDDGVEFEVAFSTDGANFTPSYSILYNANDGSAYNSEYVIVLEDNLDPAVNFGAISTFNQTEKALSVNSSNGNVSAQGSITAYGIDIKNASGSSVIETNGNDVNIIIKGTNGTSDGFNIKGGVNGEDDFINAQPNDLGGQGLLYLNGSLKVWNQLQTNLNSFNVNNQANTTITGGDFTIEDTDGVQKLKLTNATGVLEAREITSFFGGTLTFSGNIVATTQDPLDSSTKLATTEYVDLAVTAGGGNTGNFTFTNENITNTVDNIINLQASDYVQLEYNGANYVYVQDDGVWIETSNPGTSQWHFDINGNLTLPNGGLIKDNAGNTYLIENNNTWTGGLNGFQGSGYFGGTVGTFSVIDSTNTYNILNIDYSNATVNISSDSATAFKINKINNNPLLIVDSDTPLITAYVSTDFNAGEDPFVHIDTANRLFEIVDALDGTLFSVDSNGDVVVTGDLTVNGTTTTINTTNLNVEDNLIELAHGIAGVPTNDAGFVIARGDEHNASLFWNEASDTFIFATSASINSLSTGNLLNLGGTITYSTVRVGALEANTISASGAGTLSITGAIAIAKTINLAGAVTGSLDLNDANTAITLNTTLGTITNADLEYDSILIDAGAGGSANIALGGTLNISGVVNSTSVFFEDGDLFITLAPTLSIQTISLSPNDPSALDITDGSDSYLNFNTSLDKVVVGKTLDVTNSHILLNSSEGSRYACTDPVFVANTVTLSSPFNYINKDAYFLNNGGVAGTVNLFALSGTTYDGYVLALFNTDSATMTIAANGGQTISGSETKDIPAGGCLTIMAKGTSWYIM